MLTSRLDDQVDANIACRTSAVERLGRVVLSTLHYLHRRAPRAAARAAALFTYTTLYQPSIYAHKGFHFMTLVKGENVMAIDRSR